MTEKKWEKGLGIERGYICDRCSREIPVHQYSAHRRKCFNEHYQLVDTTGQDVMNKLIDIRSLLKKPTRFRDSRLTLIEVGR